MKISTTLLTATTILTLGLGITGCAPANIASQMRTHSDNNNMTTRCIEVDMRNQKEMDKLFAKYDGWRVLYISEYTTDNLFGTSGSVCFEKAN